MANGRSAMLDEITPVILTWNEAPNIARTLAALDWAKEIVAVDSGSTDETLQILKADPRVRLFHRPFDTHCRQWQFATGETAISTRWILRLDADYLLPAALVEEISRLDPDGPENAYRIGFDYAIGGRKLRASLYPPNTVLLRQGRYAISDAGHTEAWTVRGGIGTLKHRIVHDDRKPLSRWLASQQSYAQREAEYLLSGREDLSWTDRLRRAGWIVPILTPFYVLFVKGCILDGRAGWFYMLQRLVAEIMIALAVIEMRAAKRRQ